MLYDFICISCISHNFCPYYSWIVCWLVHLYSPWESSRAPGPAGPQCQVDLVTEAEKNAGQTQCETFFFRLFQKGYCSCSSEHPMLENDDPMVDMCCLIDIHMFFFGGACTAVLFLDGPAMKRWEPQEFLRFRAAIHASGRRNLGWGHGTLTSKSIKIGFGRTCAGWWFGTFLIFLNSWDDDPIWLIFFRGVEATNQVAIGSGYGSVPSTSHWRFELIWIIQAETSHRDSSHR